MNEESYKAAASLVSKTYVTQGKDARRNHEKHVQVLMQQHKVPEEGWEDSRIRLLLHELAMMDSNNFPENVGVGEREARIASKLVQERHFWFGHGIGRSGDVSAVQPKAAGSSLLNKLTNSLLLDLLRRTGVPATQACVLIPVATGMALLLVLLTLRHQRPTAKYIIWPRIDQKSCFKCISSAGYEAVVVENVLEGDELRTDIDAIEREVKERGVDNVLCVFTTTSCFAPRAADKLPEVAQLCQKYGVPHVVNNAYGIQSSKCMYLIQEACRVGRVDAFIQSTDKNLLVPVGGAVVASSNAEFVQQVAQIYPGRASATPSLDVFITLLSLGWKGYKQLLADRKVNYQYLVEQVQVVADKHGERVLSTRNNPISIAITLDSLPNSDVDWTEFGSMLFLRNVSGTRVVAPGSKKIGSHTFVNWGAHCDHYSCTYLTAAAAIGMHKEEVDTFCKRLDKCFTKFKQRYSDSAVQSSLASQNQAVLLDKTTASPSATSRTN